MNQFDYEIQYVCSRLYSGWIEKEELPQLASDPAINAAARELLGKLGLELVDAPESKWYVVRLLKENDSFSHIHKYHPNLQGRHMALLLILYCKLLLPRRAGQVDQNTELFVTFQELYETYGYKFLPNRRRTTSETAIKQLLGSLVKSGYIVKVYGKSLYTAGPLMYTLHDDLLTDVAEASLQTLFGFDTKEGENIAEN